MKLAAQENLIPGASLEEKWAFAQGLGFAGIELRGEGDFALRERLPALRAARKGGVVFSSVCVIMDHFVGDTDPDRRRDAIENMKLLLSVIGELGGVGAITPAAYGLHSNVLPPFAPPRTPEEDRAVLLDGLGTLAEHARGEGTLLLIEPLNRYEDHMLNTLDEGTALCRALGDPGMRLMADLFHMSIEETDLVDALADNVEHLAHVHVADSNRREPGLGHTDFRRVDALLEERGYTGFWALECMPKAAPGEALENTARHLLPNRATGGRGTTSDA